MEFFKIDSNLPLEFLPKEIRESIIEALQADGDTQMLHGEQIQERGSDGSKSEKVAPPAQKIAFNFDMTNSNQDLRVLTEKLIASSHRQYGLLLWGVSGSGKSYYGQYLAQELGMPLIKKRASDLIDKYVGNTERNIRAAFKEAKDAKAVLLFDEADSFLFDRTHARQDFQAAQVNEILTQMEDHPYPFIMTTNLKDKIDRAALRRFIFKIKYDYMKDTHVQAGVQTYFGKKYKLNKTQLAELTHLCAGDFKVAKAKCDILDDGKYSNALIFDYLKHELEEKEIAKGSAKINI